MKGVLFLQSHPLKEVFFVRFSFGNRLGRTIEATGWGSNAGAETWMWYLGDFVDELQGISQHHHLSEDMGR